MASFIINCPNCHHQFEPGDSIREEVEKELRGKVIEWQKKKDEEFRQKEQEAARQLETEKKTPAG